MDGAFGLWAAASPKYRHLTDGFELADSWATDAHKWPNTGYDCGIALVRKQSALRAAMAIGAAYLAPGELREPGHYTPEMSRRARGIELWAALRSLGRSGVAELIERTCGYAQRFAEGLREAGYEILNEVAINQVLVSFGSAGGYPLGDRAAATGRHVLVRWDGMAGACGDAHQRFVVGYDRRGCGGQFGGYPTNRG